jgi:hypothetical protein
MTSFGLFKFFSNQSVETTGGTSLAKAARGKMKINATIKE